VRELADLDVEQMAALGALALDGPRCHVRLLAAGERSASELVQRCAFLNEFSTRIVLQAADEDESVALLGTPGAEELGAGGQILVRLDGRTPVQANAYRVAPQHLTRLLKLIGERAEPAPSDVHVVLDPGQAVDPLPEVPPEQPGSEVDDADARLQLEDVGQTRDVEALPQQTLTRDGCEAAES